MEEFINHWNYLFVDEAGLVQQVNDQANSWFSGETVIGIPVTKALPWFKRKWISANPLPRIASLANGTKILLEIIPDTEQVGGSHIFFRKSSDYSFYADNLLCNQSQLIFDLQEFIDTSYDGIVISDGTGVIIAVNESFVHISGLNREDFVGKHFRALIKSGTISQSVAQKALQKKKPVSAIIKYPSGKEAMITSTPLFDKKGKVIRIVSNARDLTELNSLNCELKKTKTLVKNFQQELKAMQVANTDINISLVRSQAMKQLYELATKVAKTDLQLLITGDSGVGKTVLAKYIHTISERHSTGSFIHINCSSIPESLLESELFGHEEGSFTGARRLKAGLFEMADKGTLLLDEIGDMPLALQAKLLNVLQERSFYRVGGTKEVKTDVRVIAATNANLEQLILKGLFREDLYYRLNVVPIRVPSLAERREDLLPLIYYYLEQSNKRFNCSKTIAPDAMDILLTYHWPGNIRELINFIERAVVIVDDPVIETRHLKELVSGTSLLKLIDMKDKTGLGSNKLWRPHVHLKDMLAKLEEQIIAEAVTECGSFKEAAINLGIDVATLFRKRNRKNKLYESG